MRTTKDFIEELKCINENITVIGKYIRSDEPIDVKCTICGYEWDPQARELLRGKGCPVCAGKTILPGYNDLATEAPELAEEWNKERNEITPSEISKGSNKKVWWRCKHFPEHEWQATPDNRYYNKSGCKWCQQEYNTSLPEKIVLYYMKKAFSDTVSNVHLDGFGKLELDVFIPSINTAIEYDGYRWHKNVERDCNKNNLCSEAGIRLIRIREPRCPSIEGENYLLNTCSFKELEQVLSSLISSLGKNVDVDFYRDYIEIQDMVDHHVVENSLAEMYPAIAEEWHPNKNGKLLPTDVKYSSNRYAWWKCKNNPKHEWPQTINNRTNHNSGCPYCSGRIALSGESDFATVYPTLLEEWDYDKNEVDPTQIRPGSGISVYWKCKKYPETHKWQMKVESRTGSKKQGCPYCANKKILKGFNDLETRFPEIATEWFDEKNEDLEPSDFMPGSHEEVWWQCKKNPSHIYPARINDRTSVNHSGCPWCSGLKHPKIYCVETGKLYSTNTALSKEIGVSMASVTRVLKGEATSAKGFHFHYSFDNVTNK